MLLSIAERRLGVAERLARCIPDRRDPSRIAHTIADMIRARVFAICCGYEDAGDLDVLRSDPAFKLACGRLPDSGRDLCSQPTLSRLENAPGFKDVIRLTYALVEQWMASYATPPSSVTLDIDDTCDVAHGHQQLSLFNAHFDERCFLPIHVYDTEKSRPVAVVLRPGKTPSGVEVRAHLRRLVRRIRSRWPMTCILFRGDGHYARPEAMTWCEDNEVDYLFGLPGSKPLSKKARGRAENLIKLHKTQLASDRTSCRSALANQVRLVLHTAAYWLMLAVRDVNPKARDLAAAEFATLRLKLLKIAARVVEIATRVRLAYAAGCPEADLFASLAAALTPSGP
jgi:Transposase DDE domain group 1